jgi:hypothetical protein
MITEVGDVSAYFADGTELVFPASELTFLAPLASGATGSHALTVDSSFAAFDGMATNGTSLFSLTTTEPVHTFSFQLNGGHDLAIYRDDVLVSNVPESSVASGVTVTHEHRVSPFLAVVGSGT